MSPDHTFVSEEARQMILLSLALNALLHPGFDYFCAEIAKELGGLEMYQKLKSFNEDQVKPL